MAMLLDLVESQVAAARTGAAPDFGLIKAILDYFLVYPDLHHHPKEDLIGLRLRVRDRAKAEAVERLLAGHEDIAVLTRRFARATVDQLLNPGALESQWFASMGREFVDINRRHMAEEEEHFFPLAEKVLTREDWAAINARVSDPEDPLFGRALERRFQGLHQAILEVAHDS